MQHCCLHQLPGTKPGRRKHEIGRRQSEWNLQVNVNHNLGMITSNILKLHSTFTGTSMVHVLQTVCSCKHETFRWWMLFQQWGKHHHSVLILRTQNKTSLLWQHPWNRKQEGTPLQDKEVAHCFWRPAISCPLAQVPAFSWQACCASCKMSHRLLANQNRVC